MVLYDHYAEEAALFSKLRDNIEDRVTKEDADKVLGQMRAMTLYDPSMLVYFLAKQMKLEARVRRLESKHNG